MQVIGFLVLATGLYLIWSSGAPRRRWLRRSHHADRLFPPL